MQTKLKTNRWLNNRFESSSYKTPEFLQFARDYKSDIKNLIGDNSKVCGHYKLVSYSVGHFYISGFIENINTKKLAYFCTSDVRFFPDEWSRSLLIRTASHIKDFTGGANRFTELTDIRQGLENSIA